MMDAVFSYCSWLENDMSSNIINFVNKWQGKPVPKWKVDQFLRQEHIDYYSLPQYMKDELDKLNVYN